MLEITSVAGDRLSRLAAPITPARVAQAGSDAMAKFGGAENSMDASRTRSRPRSERSPRPPPKLSRRRQMPAPSAKQNTVSGG